MILKNCDSCMIYGPEDGIRIPGRVSHIEDKITLFFNDSSGSELPLNRIRIDFYDSITGIVKAFCELAVRKNTDPWATETWAADCVILETLEIQQRQKDLRVRLGEKLLFSSSAQKTKLEGELTFSAPAQGRDFHGFIDNISVGGIFLVTDEIRLAPNTEVTFTYCFSKQARTLTAVTLREQQLRKERFGYGCQFINMVNHVEREIRQFVYKKQLGQMR